jgi:7-cyano-7-deazaguanine synthase in queuosine biosynthesis
MLDKKRNFFTYVTYFNCKDVVWIMCICQMMQIYIIIFQYFQQNQDNSLCFHKKIMSMQAEHKVLSMSWLKRLKI